MPHLKDLPSRPEGYADLLYAKDAGVATITINKPDVYNAFSTRTYEEMYWAITDAADDPEIGVVVITGAGDKSFSSGGNVNEKAERTSDVGRVHVSRALQLSLAIRNCGKPVIAAVNGVAVGGGFQLQSWCDITIASDHARFGSVEVKVGSFGWWGSQVLLPRTIGEKKAREMFFRGRLYSAQEALEMGLINVVVPHAKLFTEVDAWCQDILDKSPTYLRFAKLALNAGSDTQWGTVFTNAEMLAVTYGTEENVEGAVAFVEKRPSDYRRFRRPLDRDEHGADS